jgi:hypothetical protein
MSTIEKLKKELKARPKTFDYMDARRLLVHEGYEEDTGGKTSGSRVKFANSAGVTFALHKPHPEKNLKEYAVNDLADFLEKEGKL